jgi:hypothetical protein
MERRVSDSNQIQTQVTPIPIPMGHKIWGINGYSCIPDQNKTQRTGRLPIDKFFRIAQQDVHVWIDALELALVFRLTPLEADEDFSADAIEEILLVLFLDGCDNSLQKDVVGIMIRVGGRVWMGSHTEPVGTGGGWVVGTIEPG